MSSKLQHRRPYGRATSVLVLGHHWVLERQEAVERGLLERNLVEERTHRVLTCSPLGSGTTSGRRSQARWMAELTRDASIFLLSAVRIGGTIKLHNGRNDAPTTPSKLVC